MNVKQQYKKLISDYLALGGSQRFIDKLPKLYSLQNEAKIRTELRKLKQHPIKTSEAKETPEIVEITTAENNSKNIVIKPDSSLNDIGLISEYPVELHPVYLERRNEWIKACSLKIQLNNVAIKDEEEAFKLQLEIYKSINIVDAANKELLHYKTYKRLLPKDIKNDFSTLTEVELLKKRNNLRSNISNRKRTIEKIKISLSKATDKNKLKLTDKLSSKLEQLEKFQIQVDNINKLLEEKETRG